MKTAIRLFIVLVVLAGVLGGIFGWKYLQMQKSAEQRGRAQPPIPVEAVTIKARSWRSEIRSVGSLRAINGVNVANEVAGVVSEVVFESGQRVKRGDVLIRLERDVDQAALAALAAQAQLANETFQRFSELLPSNSVSRSQFDEAQANYHAARANVEQQRAQLQKKTIRAPFGGMLGLRQIDQGEYISAGTAIVDLNMLHPIYADYSVPENKLQQITPGGSIEVRVAAYPDRVFTGEVLAMAPSINESSRTLAVRAQLDNPERILLPGMFADISTLAAESRHVLTLPRTALSYNTYGDFVFKLVKNDQEQLVITRQQVTTGNKRGDEIEIVRGLQAGDQVVATGLQRLRDGQPVRIANNAADQQDAAGGRNSSSGDKPSTGAES